jgi:hypothetical protein
VDHPARIARSLPLDANELHHLAPLLGFIGDEFTEVVRRPRKGLTAQLSKPRLNLGIGPALTSSFSVSMISAGVLLGAPKPVIPLASPGKKSPMAGTSGSVSERVVVVTPNCRDFFRSKVLRRRPK